MHAAEYVHWGLGVPSGRRLIFMTRPWGVKFRVKMRTVAISDSARDRSGRAWALRERRAYITGHAEIEAPNSARGSEISYKRATITMAGCDCRYHAGVNLSRRGHRS